MTTCYAPCITEKQFSDAMHVAHGEQDAVCSQAAKYGQIAKDKEKQRQEDKNNKGKKKPDPQSTNEVKDINELNSKLTDSQSSLSVVENEIDMQDDTNSLNDDKIGDTQAEFNPNARNPDAASGGKYGKANNEAGTPHASGEAGKSVSGGDSDSMTDSGAATSASNMLLGLCGVGLVALTTNMIPFF
ncbi:hypothetical protein COEREDRAFT_89445 [Coemansia reversa NRRL 1564]|uniref:Uncharacterized protein n=1 Tax=Coemansia reversa (strain ATCC 12441 / NRRL 1564) TaxID=763665 RepID=A0A2G5B3M9_COERN|nr:hypothetical protein COEREDRAFT_89445 [Coemansia reversa NRRL 1564]|eukprot:PIA13618.1 hypothetical protein COEREDRAFT_89445 [Coemansia reversa NRRL 1564]